PGMDLRPLVNPGMDLRPLVNPGMDLRTLGGPGGTSGRATTGVGGIARGNLILPGFGNPLPWAIGTGATRNASTATGSGLQPLGFAPFPNLPSAGPASAQTTGSLRGGTAPAGSTLPAQNVQVGMVGNTVVLRGTILAPSAAAGEQQRQLIETMI